MQVFTVLVGSLDIVECFQIELNANASHCHYIPQYVFLERKLFVFLIFELLRRPTFWSRTLILEFPVSRSHTSETWVGTNRGVTPEEAAKLPALHNLEQTSCYCVKKIFHFFQ